MVTIAVETTTPASMLLILAALVVVGAAIAIVKGLDVRFVLLSAALALAGLAGDVRPVVREFLATFSNEQFVIPLCSALGFAYVLRYTQCDRHLVHLLTKPLRRARLFLIPGIVLVGFLVNIPVISQTSTAVCLGAVVVPLMRAAGISPLTIGASILLGSSLGGDLLNPGAPELQTIAQNQGKEPGAMVPAVMRIVFYHLAIATAIFWWMSARAERTEITGASLAPDDAKPQAAIQINYLRALVPIIPLILLFLSGPPLNIVRVPDEWLIDARSKSAYGTRLIGLAMLCGVFAAALTTPKQVAGIPRAFFEGAGVGFATIISIIVAANCFGAGVKQIGLAKHIADLVEAAPNLLLPLAASIPFAFATLCGSGMASTQSLYALFVPPAEALGVNRLDLGAVVSIGAAAGRTMSPVAAVTLMCGSMTQTSPFALAKRVALPVLISWVIVVGLRMMGVI